MSEGDRIEVAMRLAAMELATIESERWCGYVFGLLRLLQDGTDAHSYQAFLRWLQTDIEATLISRERTQ